MKNIWMSQADTISLDDENAIKVLYENSTVKEFLSADNSKGISATKGMGKTFLIKIKRFRKQSEINSGTLFLPKDRLVDVSAPIFLTKSQLTLLENYDNWVNLWISLLGIYLLSLPELHDLIESDDEKMLPPYVWELLNSHEYTGIFEVLSIVLMKQEKSSLMEVITSSPYLFTKINRIQRSIYIFVDKLEEPFNRHIYRINHSTKSSYGPTNESIWAYSQISFAEMTYRLSVRNHIKIFYSIRQEAFECIESIATECSKIKDMTCMLNYTSRELFEMYQKYIENENDTALCVPSEKFKNPNKAFLGIEYMPHKSGVKEPIWDYI